MAEYIHELRGWPNFTWSHEKLASKLAAVRHHQGLLIGRMEALGFQLRAEAVLQSLTEEVLKSSEIEGEFLDRDQVRSSIARRLGMDVGALLPADRDVEGVVRMPSCSICLLTYVAIRFAASTGFSGLKYQA